MHDFPVIKHIKVKSDHRSAILNLIKLTFFTVYSYLKPHILFNSNGLAIWQGFSVITYIQVKNIYYSLSDGGEWSKMKVSFSVSSQSILKRFTRNFVNPIFYSFGIDLENFVKKYWIVQKLDHLTCSKCPFMTLLYNMYKPINFIPVFPQNCVTCQMV